jgi:hypothetical protein
MFSALGAKAREDIPAKPEEKKRPPNPSLPAQRKRHLLVVTSLRQFRAQIKTTILRRSKLLQLPKRFQSPRREWKGGSP